MRSTSDWMAQERSKKERRPLYGRVLAADIRARRPLRLLMHVFGPGCQRFDLALPWLMCAAISLATRLAVDMWWPQYAASVADWAMLAGAAGISTMAIMSASRFALNLPLTVGEQALFRLAPAAPGAAQLNRVLARTLLRTCLVEWAGTLVLMLGVAVMWGAPARILLGHFTLMCALLMFAGWPLRDHARDPRTRYGLVVVLMALAMGMGTLIFISVGQHWLWALCLTISLLFIRRRYAAMVGAPPAFPARRLAQ